MGILDWFRSKPAPEGERAPLDMEAELERLEKESAAAGQGFGWGPLNRAGDLCLRMGDRARALQFYGRTIDTLLADGQREAARGVANKIIRVHPDAVRTLCTLTWLDLSAQHMATALLHLRDYVQAAKKAGQEHITAEQIVDMARLNGDDEFLVAVADALDQLDYPAKAGIVREWQRTGGSPEALTDPEQISEAFLARAIATNEGRTSGG